MFRKCLHVNSNCTLRLLPFVLCACATDGELPTDYDSLGAMGQPMIFIDDVPAETCSASRKAAVQRAEEFAFLAVDAASRSVGNNRLYKRWFGTFSSGRASDVQQVLDDVMSNWFFDEADCNKPTLCTSANPPNAWILGTGPIHLCSPVFNLPSALRMIPGGISGTLMHERVHGVSVVIDESNAVCTAGSSLVCNGYRDDLALAAASATEAVNNADNYELFAIEAHAARIINPALALFLL